MMQLKFLPNIICFLTTLLFTSSIFASSTTDFFRSRASGNFNAVAVWESSNNNLNWVIADKFPGTQSRGITIRNGHNLSILSRTNVDDFFINSGGTLNIANGIDFTIVNGSATIDGDISGLIINQGNFIVQGNLIFRGTGIYQHATNVNPNRFPIATWEEGSNTEVTGFSTFSSGILNLDQSFYNFTWNCPGQLASSNPGLGITNMTVRNNFNVLSTGAGSFAISGSIFNLNILNYSQSGGTLIVNPVSNPAIIGNILISNNFNMAGGTLSNGPGSTGNIIFNGTSNQNYIKTGGNLINALNFRINSNAIVNFGTSIISGNTGTFTAQSNSTLITANADGFALTGATGSVQSTGARSYSTTANYSYNGATQNTGTGLPATVNNLTIDNGAVVTLRTGALTVNGNLTINSGSLNLGTSLLTTTGADGLLGSGTLLTQNTSASPLSANKNWTGTVSYNSASPQTIVSGSYNNLSGSGGNRTLGTTINIAGDFVPGTPSLYTTTGSTVHFNGTGTQTIPSLSYNNLTGTGGARILGASINIAGAFTPGSPASYITTGSTVNFNGAGTQDIPAFNFNNLSASTSGTKTVSGAASVVNVLQVSDAAILNANGNLTLLATATNNANFAELSGSADIIGNVNVQSYLYGEPSGAIRGTKSMSSPINDAATIGAKTFAQLKNFVIITGPGGVTNGFDAGPGPVVTFNPVTLNFYTETASPSASSFTPVPTLATSTTPGTGFLTFFRGNRNGIYDTPGKLRSPFSAAEDVLVTYTGPINKGNIDITLGRTNFGDAFDGFYLAGNPYPATIDWNAVLSASTNLNSTITIVTGGKANATYNAIGDVSVNGGSRYIQPGQGFYVQANVAGATLRFRENQKNIVSAPARLLSLPNQPTLQVDASSQNDLKLAVNTNPIAPVVQNTNKKVLKMKLVSGEFEEEALALFDDQFLPESNFRDSRYLPGFDVNLATLSSDNIPLAINLMPNVQPNDKIKLSVNAKTSRVMTLEFNDINIDPSIELWLEDKYLNTLTPISLGSKYDFNIDKTNVNTFGDNRFQLLFNPPATLPVEMASFMAKKSNNETSLQWETLSESNNKGFEVERLVEETNQFVKIGFVEALRTNTALKAYSYIDKLPLQGENYYRLKQVDLDGKFTYSEIKLVNFGLTTNELTIYPNPTSDYIKVSLVNKNSNNYTTRIIGLNGLELKKNIFNKTQEIKEDVSNLPVGIYIFEVRDSANSLLSTNKFIKY